MNVIRLNLHYLHVQSTYFVSHAEIKTNQIQIPQSGIHSNKCDYYCVFQIKYTILQFASDQLTAMSVAIRLLRRNKVLVAQNAVDFGRVKHIVTHVYRSPPEQSQNIHETQLYCFCC